MPIHGVPSTVQFGMNMGEMPAGKKRKSGLRLKPWQNRAEQASWPEPGPQEANVIKKPMLELEHKPAAAAPARRLELTGRAPAARPALTGRAPVARRALTGRAPMKALEGPKSEAPALVGVKKPVPVLPGSGGVQLALPRAAEGDNPPPQRGGAKKPKPDTPKPAAPKKSAPKKAAPKKPAVPKQVPPKKQPPKKK